jgi:hypothetical protein
VLLILVLTVVQVALMWHAGNVADGAASRAARTAAELDGSAGRGVAAATSFISASGAQLSGSPAVARGGSTATATVAVHVPRVLPGFPAAVSRTAVATVERFVPEGDR